MTELTFSSEDRTTPPPTVQITVGSRTYTATAPKEVYWLELFFLFERQERADLAKQSLSSGGSSLAAATSGDTVSPEVIAAQLGAPMAGEINEKLMNFLDACLTDKDAEQIISDLKHKTNRTVDIRDVHNAAYGLYHEFRGWFTEQFDAVNMDTSNAQNHKNPAKKPATEKQPVKVATRKK